VNTRTALQILSESVGVVAPDIDLDSLDSTASLREQADLDSIDFLELVSLLARAVKADIPEDDYPRLDTVDTAVAYLAGKAPDGSAGPGR
jgi:acyl carrier protein